MGLVVQKYGGTSVANSDRLKAVAKRVVDTKKAGNDVVVVLSAPAGMTDDLTKRARELSDTPNKRELDMLLVTGEQISISLLTMAIHQLGEDAISFTAAQVGILTDNSHTKARIRSISTDKIREKLETGHIVVVAGFQGITENFDITTLGRGGSDTTGVALGVALNADEVEIYTDVDGVYSADPRLVEDAKKIQEISYEEMLELASSGAKVLHSRSVELAAKHDLKVHLRSSFSDAKGTIVKGGHMENCLVKGLAHSQSEAKIIVSNVPDKVGIAAHIFREMAKHNISIDLISHNLEKTGFQTLSFIIKLSDLEEAEKVLETSKEKIGAESIVIERDIAKVSLVGFGIKSNPGVVASVFETLAEEGINIHIISCSEITITCIIDKKSLEKAIKALHKKFNL